ncbi:hypothetical protein GCM10011402_17120 [Paracoccus acridae]|uniref:Uncharacterized protein n=1 Tax=Paracoccus acridae TaxID=1795310 RepID=A0ABQ1VGL1_9RHOB|nr:hypothetical protein GCM10011402_17120 [Paracoccus acridae]
MPYAVAARTMVADMAESVPVAGGAIDTRAEVTITWEIAPASEAGSSAPIK